MKTAVIIAALIGLIVAATIIYRGAGSVNTQVQQSQQQTTSLFDRLK